MNIETIPNTHPVSVGPKLAVLEISPSILMNPQTAMQLLEHVERVGGRVVFQGQGFVIVERVLSVAEALAPYWPR